MSQNLKVESPDWIMDEKLSGKQQFEQGSRLMTCHLSRLDASGQTLRDVTVKLSKLEKANFSGATLENVEFGGCTLEGVNFSGATLRNVKFYTISHQRSQANDINLTGATLENVEFQNHSIREMKLSESLIEGLYLRNCDLTQIELKTFGQAHARVSAMKVEGCTPGAWDGAKDAGIYADKSEMANAQFAPRDAEYFAHLMEKKLTKDQARAQVQLWRNLLRSIEGGDPRPSQQDCWDRAREAITQALKAFEVDLMEAHRTAPGLFADTYDSQSVNVGTRSLAELLNGHPTGFFIANTVKNRFGKL